MCTRLVRPMPQEFEYHVPLNFCKQCLHISLNGENYSKVMFFAISVSLTILFISGIPKGDG